MYHFAPKWGKFLIHMVKSPIGKKSGPGDLSKKFENFLPRRFFLCVCMHVCAFKNLKDLRFSENISYFEIYFKKFRPLKGL